MPDLPPEERFVPQGSRILHQRRERRLMPRAQSPTGTAWEWGPWQTVTSPSGDSGMFFYRTLRKQRELEARARLQQDVTEVRVVNMDGDAGDHLRYDRALTAEAIAEIRDWAITRHGADVNVTVTRQPRETH